MKAKEKRVFIEIYNIKSFLETLKTAKEKIEYLEYLKHEYLQILNSYTDDDIYMLVRKIRESEHLEYKKSTERMNIFVDSGPIDHLEYKKLPHQIKKNLLPFVSKEIESMNKNHLDKSISTQHKLLLDIIEIRKYLKTVNKAQDKYEFLNFLTQEFDLICNHYTDDNIAAEINKNGISDNFKTLTLIGNHLCTDPNKSAFISLKDKLNKHVLPFIKREMDKLSEIQDMNNQTQSTTNPIKKDEQGKQKTTEKITWLKNKTDFVSLFERLETLGFISFKKNKNNILEEHFTFIDGDIKKNSLKSSRNNLKNSPEIYSPSDEMKVILKELDQSTQKVVKQ